MAGIEETDASAGHSMPSWIGKMDFICFVVIFAWMLDVAC